MYAEQHDTQQMPQQNPSTLISSSANTSIIICFNSVARLLITLITRGQKIDKDIDLTNVHF